MAGESDQVCHAYHDLHEILISPQICILCSSGDNECNGTVIDGNWKYYCRGWVFCDGSKERVKVI